MERGFKARCEEMARSLRIELGLTRISPLVPNQLASYLNVPVWQVTELELSKDDLRQLIEVDPDSWSAITVAVSGREAIIVNPNHRGGRYSSDVMHELAHLLLGHEPNTVFFSGDGDIALRGYNGPAEEEANWLAGALLLPREALVWNRRMHVSNQEISQRYCVSEQMVKYRTQVTGLDRQFKFRKSSSTQHK